MSLRHANNLLDEVRRIRAEVKATALRPLYVRRDLINKKEFFAWAKSQGFTNVVDDPHVTVLYSRTPVDWIAMGEDYSARIEISPGGPRVVEPLGDKGAIVLHFASTDLRWRHERMVEAGASHDYDEYQCHVTISYAPGDVDLESVEPYRGELIFGPEIFEEPKIS